MATLSVIGVASVLFGAWSIREPKKAFAALGFLIVTGEILALAAFFD